MTRLPTGVMLASGQRSAFCGLAHGPRYRLVWRVSPASTRWMQCASGLASGRDVGHASVTRLPQRFTQPLTLKAG
jgi:hypothetical protein